MSINRPSRFPSAALPIAYRRPLLRLLARWALPARFPLGALPLAAEARTAAAGLPLAALRAPGKLDMSLELSRVLDLSPRFLPPKPYFLSLASRPLLTRGFLLSRSLSPPRLRLPRLTSPSPRMMSSSCWSSLSCRPLLSPALRFFHCLTASSVSFFCCARCLAFSACS